MTVLSQGGDGKLSPIDIIIGVILGVIKLKVLIKGGYCCVVVPCKFTYFHFFLLINFTYFHFFLLLNSLTFTSCKCH